MDIGKGIAIADMWIGLGMLALSEARVGFAYYVAATVLTFIAVLKKN